MRYDLSPVRQWFSDLVLSIGSPAGLVKRQMGPTPTVSVSVGLRGGAEILHF